MSTGRTDVQGDRKQEEREQCVIRNAFGKCFWWKIVDAGA